MNEQLERLIVRSLDGELRGDEQLELDRELMRNPQARKVMDEYRSIDDACESVLCGIADKAAFETAMLPRTVAVSVPKWHRFRRMWILVSGAVAAALLAIVVPYPHAREWTRSNSLSPAVEDLAPVLQAPVSRYSSEGGLMRSVGSWPSIHKKTGRDLIGVIGDDGNLYWIEVEHSRTVRIPDVTSAGKHRLDNVY